MNMKGELGKQRQESERIEEEAEFGSYNTGAETISIIIFIVTPKRKITTRMEGIIKK